MECAQCGSPMELREEAWMCGTCFNVVTAEHMGDNTVLEDGLTLQDVLRQMEERE
ncbi:MAG: hypothetical protein WD645_04230 [Dehalococcoidia bacterium]